MKKTQTEEPIVNHRWNLVSVPELLDKMLPQWSEGGHPDFSGPDGYEKLRGAFERFGAYLLQSMAYSLEKAAGKGIAQAIALMLDPDYRKTVRRRTKRQIEREKEHRAKQDAERERWKRGELTFEERKYEIGRLTRSIAEAEKRIEEMRERKMKIETNAPVTVAPDNKPEWLNDSDDDGDDEWPDRISFD